MQVPLPVVSQPAPEKSGEAETKTSVSFFRFVVVLVCVVLLCVLNMLVVPNLAAAKRSLSQPAKGSEGKSKEPRCQDQREC